MDKCINGTDTTNLTKYRKIMENYKNGEYGSDHLTLNEILLRAGEPDLLRQMNLAELDELINTSFGMNKQLFVTIKNEVIKKTKSGTGLVKKMNTKNIQYK